MGVPLLLRTSATDLFAQAKQRPCADHPRPSSHERTNERTVDNDHCPRWRISPRAWMMLFSHFVLPLDLVKTYPYPYNRCSLCPLAPPARPADPKPTRPVRIESSSALSSYPFHPSIQPSIIPDHPVVANPPATPFRFRPPSCRCTYACAARVWVWMCMPTSM